ncbi:MAG: nitroreductase family protein [Alphaproteobacteria bacterium]|nr:nitroreductase family protein [Alphaproteobacteria bacterium]
MKPESRIGLFLWNVKLRLQFTGWLQFLPPMVLALLLLLLAAPLWALGLPVLPQALGAVAGLLLLNAVFELTTLKLGLRPPEPIPPPIGDDVDDFDLMRGRRSCRSFQRRELTPAHKAELLELARAVTAPSALLGEAPIRLEYIAAPLTVWPVLNAHEFLVAIAPVAYDRMAVVDVGRSLQNVVLRATRMGVATCWIGPGADQSSVAAHLGERFDPARDHIVCVCALGYRSRLLPLTIRLMVRTQNKRLPLERLFFAEPTLKEPLDVEAAPFAQFGRCYEACQWSPSSYNAQPTRCAAVLEPTDGAARLARFDFFATTGSRWYAPVALGIWCADWETGCAALGIPGRFAVVESGHEVDGARYDVSWVLDEPVALQAAG